MDGWEFLGNWKRRKFACEEGKNMVGKEYGWHSLSGLGLGGSQQRNVEGLVGWRFVPDTLLRSLLMEEEITPWTEKRRPISTQHIRIHKSIASFQV